MKQQKLFSEKIKNEFGGSLPKGKRKERRPLHSKLPAHLVLKATNTFVLVFNKTEVESLLQRYAKRFGVRIYDTGIHADHIHLSALFSCRESYVKWIRAVTSVLVQKFRGLRWKLRPYTRISKWGKAFARLRLYIGKNKDEGEMIVRAHDYVDRFRRKAFERYVVT